MPGIARSDASNGNGSPQQEPRTIRAFDCFDPIHEEAHFTAETDDVLAQKVVGHFEQYHPDVSEQKVLELVATGTYLEPLDVEDLPDRPGVPA